MAKTPSKMSRAEILAKVLEVNPDLRMGDMSAEEMSEHLMQTVRESRQAPKFSAERFVSVFTAMLSDVEERFGKGVQPIHDALHAVDVAEQALKEKALEQLLLFLAHAQPGALSEQAREILKKNMSAFGRLNLPLAQLSVMIREKSAEIKS